MTNGFVSPNVLGQPDAGEPRPTEAAEGILKIFDRFPLVALGEWHGNRCLGIVEEKCNAKAVEKLPLLNF